MSNVTDNVEECALELEVVGTRWDEKRNWRCFGEVILYVMTSPEKLKQSFIAELDSYFDTASPRRLLWGTIILQEKPKLFSPRYVTYTLNGHFDWPFEPPCRRLRLTISPMKPKHGRVVLRCSPSENGSGVKSEL